MALLKPLLKHLLRTVPADLQLYYQVRVCSVYVRELCWSMRFDSAQCRLSSNAQDIDDHLDRCLEGLLELGSTAQSIIEEAHHHRENRINEILFTITIVTATFVPANFIAGVVSTSQGGARSIHHPPLLLTKAYLLNDSSHQTVRHELQRRRKSHNAGAYVEARLPVVLAVESLRVVWRRASGQVPDEHP